MPTAAAARGRRRLSAVSVAGFEDVLVGRVGQASIGEAAFPRSASASSVPIASRRWSISVSTRETKNEATEWIPERSWPAVLRGFQPGQIGVHHLAVTLHREDECHVD